MAAPQQLQQWFQLADEDRDGKVSGGEAVRFFTKSGLAQDTLGQVWELASGGGASLNHMQFATALRLVSLAQASMGRLPPDQARAVAMGGGPQLPLPRLAGLPVPGYTPQVTGAPGYTPQVSGAYAPQVTGAPGYPPQVTGAGPRPAYGPQTTGYAPQPTGAPPRPYAPQPTGYAPQPTGPAALPRPPAAAAGYATQPTGAAAPPLNAAAFPPASAVDMQKYSTLFVTLDRDRDGLVQGSDVAASFMQSGLDKGVLKQIWDIVAGNAGALHQGQFVAAAYLVDCARRGIPVPPALPPGQFPPVAGVAPGGPGSAPTGSSAAPAQWSLSSQFGERGAQQAVTAAYNQTLPKLPDVPGQVKWDASMAPKPAQGTSQVPGMDGSVAGLLGRDERDMYESAQRDAAAKEAALAAKQAEVEAARQRERLFQDALAEIKLFKSRTDVATMQAQEVAGRLAADADDAERRYTAAYAGAQSQHEASTALREQIGGLVSRKAEAERKLELLRQELALLSSTTPSEMRQLQDEVAGLNSQLAAAEARKAQLEMQLDGARRQKVLLEQQLQDYTMAAAASEAELVRLAADMGELSSKADAARKGGSAELAELPALLGRAAGAYRSLYAAASGCGLEVAYEANLGHVGGLVWMDSLLTGTADWIDADGPGEGYVVVSALPALEGLPADTTKPGPVAAGLSASPAEAAAAAVLVPAPASAPPAVPAAAATLKQALEAGTAGAAAVTVVSATDVVTASPDAGSGGSASSASAPIALGSATVAAAELEPGEGAQDPTAPLTADVESVPVPGTTDSSVISPTTTGVGKAPADAAVVAAAPVVAGDSSGAAVDGFEDNAF